MKKLLIAAIAALSIAMSSGAAYAADNMNQGAQKTVSSSDLGADFAPMAWEIDESDAGWNSGDWNGGGGWD